MQIKSRFVPDNAGTSAVSSCVRSMANQEHLVLLDRGVDDWNELRAADPTFMPVLDNAKLSGFNLAMANLSHASLRKVDFAMCNLRGADLSHADLRGANLVGARLIGVDLRGADLSGADLRTAEDLTPEQLAEARGDETTHLPYEMPMPRAWMISSGAR